MKSGIQISAQFEFLRQSKCQRLRKRKLHRHLGGKNSPWKDTQAERILAAGRVVLQAVEKRGRSAESEGRSTLSDDVFGRDVENTRGKVVAVISGVGGAFPIKTRRKLPVQVQPKKCLKPLPRAGVIWKFSSSNIQK